MGIELPSYASALEEWRTRTNFTVGLRYRAVPPSRHYSTPRVVAYGNGLRTHPRSRPHSRSPNPIAETREGLPIPGLRYPIHYMQTPQECALCLWHLVVYSLNSSPPPLFSLSASDFSFDKFAISSNIARANVCSNAAQ